MNDFVEETDYSRVPTAELLTRIEQYADILRGASLFDLERIMSPARELAARAQLDAQRWRPVTEPPTGTTPVEVVIRAEYIVGDIADLKNNLSGWWLATSVRSGVIIAPVSWRPAAPDEEARP